MTDVEQKMRLGGVPVRVLGAPAGTAIRPHGRSRAGGPGALVVFVRDTRQLEHWTDEIVESATADRLTWVAYPKAGQLGTDLNRDILWKRLELREIRAVMAVSIDAVWTALRFRPGRAPD